MRFSTILPALFAVATSAAKFERFNDNSCPSWDNVYHEVSAAEQEKIVLEKFPKLPDIKGASGFIDLRPGKACPLNKDDTYRWVEIPAWNATGSRYGYRAGPGGIAVIYLNETDTYVACVYLGATLESGYSGRCTWMY